MNSRCIHTMWVLLAGTLLLSHNLKGIETAAEEDVAENEQIMFQQERAHANMRELEDRMFRLAEMIREAQPEDSARLLMGLRKARELLIADEMQKASQLLASLDLEQAMSEAREIIVNLEALKTLLITTNLDLELKIEKLRQLRAAREKLERLIAKEVRQHEETSSLAETEQANKSQLDPLARQETRNQRAGDEIHQTAREVSPNSLRLIHALSSASDSMGGALGKLGDAQPKSAAEKQAEAIASLKQANDEMAQLEEALRKELEDLAKQEVMENLTEMIAQQRQVRETTERLSPRVAEKRPQAIVAVKRLSPAEDRIAIKASETIELVELTQFSIVLPLALKSAHRLICGVREVLGKGRAGVAVIRDERRIEETLGALLSAMKSERASGSKPCEGKCSSCKGNRNKLLVELKMLRSMQFFVNKQTSSLDGSRSSSRDLDAEQLEQTQGIAADQAAVKKITAKLHSMSCNKCFMPTNEN